MTPSPILPLTLALCAPVWLVTVALAFLCVWAAGWSGLLPSEFWAAVVDGLAVGGGAWVWCRRWSG